MEENLDEAAANQEPPRHEEEIDLGVTAVSQGDTVAPPPTVSGSVPPPEVVDPSWIDPDRPVSESIQRRTQEVEEGSEHIGEQRARLYNGTFRQNLDPYNWMARRWWKEQVTRQHQQEAELKAQIDKHIGEIQGEADNLVAAYGEYQQTQTALAESLGVEPVEQDMVSFIRDIDLLGSETSRTSGDGQEKAAPTEEAYRAAGKILAIQDFLTPHIPVTDGPFGKQSYVDTNRTPKQTTRFRAFSKDSRLPRLEVALSRQEAAEEATQSSAKSALKISLNTESRTGAVQNAVESRYVVLDEATEALLKDNLTALEGGVALTGQTSSLRDGPDAIISFSSQIVPVEKLQEPEQAVKLQYDYKTRTRTGSNEIELVGSIDELREMAQAEIVREEWGIGNAMKTTQGPVIVLADGSKVPWHEFIQPPEAVAA